MPKITRTHKITLDGNSICCEDLVAWLNDIPADAIIIITQTHDPREKQTIFAAEERVSSR